MKISKHLRVNIDDVVFVFERPKANQDMPSGDGSQVLRSIFAKLVKVEGSITDEDGKELKLGEIKELDLPVDVCSQIIRGYTEAVKELLGVKDESPEKKSIESGSQSAPSGSL